MAYDFNSLTKQAAEASNRDKFYTDFKDVDPNVLHQISELTDWMRTKAKGSDVREVIAQLFERTWLENIKEGNANMEVSLARGSYPNLKSRLDNVDNKQKQTTEQLAQKANKDEVTNVMTPRGNIAYASLPKSGNQVGWYYYCPDGDGVHGAGNYVWNGTSWFFGGTGDEGYNLLKEDLAEIEPNGCYNLLTKIKPYNLIKINKLLENHYVDTNGIVKESDAFALTEFIDVSTYTTINFDNCGLSCWYDENKTFISYFIPNINVPYDVPENAKYIRSSIPTGSINYAIISEKNPIPKYDNGYSIFEDLYPQKKEYQEGFIHFTVPVNQNIFDYTTTIDNTIDSQNIIDVDCVLTLPTSYKNVGKPTKLLMMCHGAGKGVSGEFDWTTNSDYCRLVNRFIESGYAVFDCNGYNNESSGQNFWGAQRGIEAWRKAYQYVIDNYNVEKCFSIYGFSMGGCTALNLAFQKFPNINSIIVSSPVINLEACFNGDIGCASAMSHAYGFKDSSGGFQDCMRLQSPINRIVSINDVDYCFDYIPPIRIYFGGNEVGQAGVNKQYAIRLHNAIKNAGGYSEYREVAGRGHEICYGADNAIITEYIYWFNRYSN